MMLLRHTLKLLLVLIFIIIPSIPLATTALYRSPEAKSYKPKDIVELKICGALISTNAYFNKSTIIHNLKMYNEYNNNKKVYLKIPIKYRYYVLDFCSKNEIPVKLIYACYQWESGWCEKAVGRNKYSIDVNISQLNSKYWRTHAIAYFKSEPLYKFNPWNWRHALEVGMSFLGDLYKNCHYNYRLALASYNAGYATVMIYKFIPISTQIYVNRIERIMYSI